MLTRISLIAALGLIFGSLGTLDYESALLMEAYEKEQRPLRAAQATLDHSAIFPIAYEVSVTQSLPSGREAVTRYYTRSSNER